MVEAVRPTGGNIMDLWDNMMRPFEDEEAKLDNPSNSEGENVGDNQEGDDAVGRNEDEDEAISVEDEEGGSSKDRESRDGPK